MTPWKRPAGTIYPQIYRNFKGKTVDNKYQNYWIQDLTDEYKDKVIRNYIDCFLYEEPMNLTTGVTEDPVAVEEMHQAWIENLNLNISLICLTNDENGVTKVAGFNTLYVHSKDSPKVELKSEPTKKAFSIVSYFRTRKDIFSEFGCNEFLGGFGLYVMPEFRKQGIAEELLSARNELCKLLGIKLTVTFYSNPGSYIPAERAGFKEYVTIAYEDLAKIDKKFELPGIQKYSTVGKLMYKLCN